MAEGDLYITPKDKDQLNKIENSLKVLIQGQLILCNKLDKLLPQMEDNSKYIASMRESNSCRQPSNHGREGTLPRHRQNEEKKDLWCWYCGYNTGTKVDYIHKDCHHYGLCKKCYNQENPAVAFKKSNYEIIKGRTIDKDFIAGGI